MFKQPIEFSQYGQWRYDRYAMHSSVLGENFHCGFLRHSSGAPIQRTIYMLHGGSGADDTQAAQAMLLPVLAGLLNGHPDTQIVFPYIGSSFLHDHPTQKNKSFSEYFLKEILQACEEGTRTSDSTRFITGWSMGGQAALNMFMRVPTKFGGVGAHFPTLIAFDYSNTQAAEAYATRTHVSDDMMQVLLSEFQRVFTDAKDFARHNPLAVAQDKPASTWDHKKIYFDVGAKDEFGLFEGGEALHKVLQDKKVAHHFEVLPQGKHDGPFLHAQMSKMLKYLL